MSIGKYTKDITYVEDREFSKQNLEYSSLFKIGKGFSFGVDTGSDFVSRTTTSKKYAIGLMGLMASGIGGYAAFADNSSRNMSTNVEMPNSLANIIFMHLVMPTYGYLITKVFNHGHDIYSNKAYFGLNFSYKY